MKGVVYGSVTALLAVALGAFGAHGLHELLVTNGRIETYDLAVEYQFYHSLAILSTGLLDLSKPSVWWKRGRICFVLGITIFSGSLYILSITNQVWLGAITPIGGLLFLLGWTMLIWGGYKMTKAP